MNTIKRLALLLVVLSLPALVLTGCGGDKAQEEAAAVPAADEHAGHDHASASMPASNAFISGTIVETMNSGGYSYALLDTGDKQVWVAGPQAPDLEVGMKVSSPDGMEMKNFQAKSLDRTFESILFVGAIEPEGAHDHAGMPAMGSGGGMDKPIGGGSTVVDKAEVSGVEKLAGGYTVAEIYGQAASLANKNIKLRGNVVKFTPNIMGTNWVHIQDGTGTAETSDLTVTTSATVSAGDVVVVEGPLSVDKDFGAGYKYHVIIEGATITK